MAVKGRSRAAHGSGSIRKKIVHVKGQAYVYWEARITVGYDPGTGKQIQRSISGKTQKEVREKMQAIAVSLAQGDYMDPTKTTLAEWVKEWLDTYTADKGWATIKHYRAQCDAHIVPGLGAIKLSELDAPTIQKFYQHLIKHGKTIPKRDENGRTIKKNGKTIYENAPLSSKSVRNIHGILSKILADAVELGKLRSNPAHKVKLPKLIEEEIAPLTEEQIRAFLPAVAADEYGILLKVILFTGLRLGEALGLTWDCINFDNGTIHVNKQLQKRPKANGGTQFALPKHDKTRVLNVAPTVMKLLQRRKAEQDAQRTEAGEAWVEWDSRRRLVFTTPMGGHLQPQTVYNHFKKWAAKIGAPDARVHDLRHTYAVLCLQNGDDILTLSQNLGHATVAFTLKRYGHVSHLMRQNSADRMDSYMRSLANL